MKTAILLALFAVVAVYGAEKARYDNYKVHTVIPKTNGQLAALEYAQSEVQGYDFWSPIQGLNIPVDVMVPPHMARRFSEFLEQFGFESTVMIRDVQAAVEAQNPKRHRANRAIDWEAYYELDQIHGWLRELEAAYPGVVTVVNGGTSYEGRDILGVHVSFDSANANSAYFIEGGIHAREWIAPATVTYILNELLTSTDPAVRAIADAHDWYIFPNVNPDGYVYTFDGERLWRKTRTPYGICYGADPNRNWGYHWNDGGASNNPCSETYAGPNAFSESSTRTLSEYISTIQDKLYGYIGFHSYSQLLLIPYGHDTAHVENFDELYEVGLQAAEALEARYGTEYTVGNIAETIYVASGGSMDWVKGTYGTRVTYTYELRDTGRWGFLLPAEQIIPTGEETLDSLVVIVREFDARRNN